MDYDKCANMATVPTPLPQVCDTVTRALELARDVRTLAGSVKDKLFGSESQTSTSSAGTQTPCCVVDFLEAITGALEGAAKRLNEIDNRL